MPMSDPNKKENIIIKARIFHDKCIAHLNKQRQQQQLVHCFIEQKHVSRMNPAKMRFKTIRVENIECRDIFP